MDQGVYERWRSKFPWTDEEIASALESMAVEATEHHRSNSKIIFTACARQVRAGRLSANIVKMVLPILVKYCGVCGLDGKEVKAIYRMGTHGRCSKHKHIQPQGFLLKRKLDEARHVDISHSDAVVRNLEKKKRLGVSTKPRYQ